MQLLQYGLIIISLYSGLAGANQPDYAREQRLRDEVIDSIVVGEPIDLHDAKRRFLAIITEADQPKGAVVLLHGRGYHPAWPSVVQPLRVYLSEQGWTSLSVQMPVLDQEATYYDYVPILSHAHGRIAASLAELRKQGYQRIVLLAHSCGVHMAMSYVRAQGDQAFDAYIGIGMGATDYQQPMKQPLPLDQISKPILDIYGDDDFPAVIRYAPRRKAMLEKAGHPQSRQIQLPADHFFESANSVRQLEATVLQWLNTLTSGG